MRCHDVHPQTKINRSVSAAARPLRTTERGQSLIECALMFPMIVLLCLGIAEIGRWAFISMTVGNAATAGVQYGAQNSTLATDSAGMTTAAKNDSKITGMTATPSHFCTCDPVTGTGAGTSCTPPGSSCSTISCGSGQIVECVRVQTHVDFTPLFNLPQLPSSYQSNGNAVMRVRH